MVRALRAVIGILSSHGGMMIAVVGQWTAEQTCRVKVHGCLKVLLRSLYFCPSALQSVRVSRSVAIPLFQVSFPAALSCLCYTLSFIPP